MFDENPTHRLMRLVPGLRWLLWLLVGVIASSSITQGQMAPAIDGKSRLRARATCTARGVTRQEVRLRSGEEIYVEPQAVASNGRGDVLILGRYNHVYAPNDRGAWSEIAQDSVLGVLVSETGTAVLVISPVPVGRIRNIRVLARSDGKSEVIFVEYHPRKGVPSDSTARAWSGVLDGRDWVTIDTLPAASEPLSAAVASSLLSHRDTLFWAARAIGAYSSDVVLFHRWNGTWTSEVVPVKTAADVELTYDDRLGLLLAVVQPDPMLYRDRNSFLLWADRSDWRIARRIVHGYMEGGVYDPRFVGSPSGAVLSWWTPGPASGSGDAVEVRAVANPRESVELLPVVVDPSAAKTVNTFTALSLPDGSVGWFTQHSSADAGGPELRLTYVSDGTPRVLWSGPDPFVAFTIFGGTVSRSEVVVSGPLHDVGRDILVSLVLRIKVDCTST